MRFSRVVSIGWPLFELIEVPQMWMRSSTHIILNEEGQELDQAAQKVSEAVGNTSDAVQNGQRMIGEMGKQWMGNVHISLDERLGMYQVNMDGGVLYYVRYGLIASMLLFLFVYTLCRFIKMKNKTERHNLFHLMLAQGFLLVMLIFSQFADIPFDIMPIASSVVICVMTLSVMVGEFFTVTDQGRDWVFEHTNDVFLIADDAYAVFTKIRNFRRKFCNSFRRQRMRWNWMADFTSAVWRPYIRMKTTRKRSPVIA